MAEAKFADAGKAAGVEIWRVENLDLMRVKQPDFGKFYTGDSYIVLSTKKCGGLFGVGGFSWDIHFWLGQETSQDESGAAAIFAVELDDYLGGDPIQHREVQGHESDLFLSYFKSGIRYLPGGIATGFKHFDPNNWENVLYQVKGKRNVRVKKVEAHVSAMNRGDCFILDANHDVYVYVGKGAKRGERIRAISAANMIRDQDHGGRSRVHIVDEFSDQSEVDTFFDKLGSGSADEVADEESGGEDEEFEINEQEDISLFKAWEDQSGQVKVEKVAQYPLRYRQLDSNDCFVLDAGTAGIFVWVGRTSSKAEKQQSMARAQAFLGERKRPWWSKISRVVEGAEPAAFKQYFIDWRDESAMPTAHTHMFSANRLNAVGMMEEATELPAEELRRLVKHQGPAVGFMPDAGAGQVQVWRVEDFELQPVPEEAYGRFYGGDSYVVKYSAEQSSTCVIYFWQGETSSQDERAAAAVHAVRMDEEAGGRAIQVRVVQGHEPRHFLSIFKGRMVVYLGGHQSGFRNVQRQDTYDEDGCARGVRLFRVRGTCQDDVRVHQVPARTENLNSDDAFVLDTPAELMVWFGQESSPTERDAAKAAAKLVAPGRQARLVGEGSEPDEFWTALGGPGEYTYTAHHSQHAHQAHMPARLFHCQITLKGKFRVNEVDNYSQEDLAEDDVMVLDSGDEVYVWVGDRSSQKEKELSLKMAEDYLRMSPVHRHRATIIQIKQNEEPAGFTTLFPEWDEDYWQALTSYDDIKKQISATNPIGLSVDLGDEDY